MNVSGGSTTILSVMSSSSTLIGSVSIKTPRCFEEGISDWILTSSFFFSIFLLGSSVSGLKCTSSCFSKSSVASGFSSSLSTGISILGLDTESSLPSNTANNLLRFIKIHISCFLLINFILQFIIMLVNNRISIIGGDSSVSGSVYVVCGFRLRRLLVVMVGVIWSLLSGTSIACKELGSFTNCDLPLNIRRTIGGLLGSFVGVNDVNDNSFDSGIRSSFSGEDSGVLLHSQYKHNKFLVLPVFVLPVTNKGSNTPFANITYQNLWLFEQHCLDYWNTLHGHKTSCKILDLFLRPEFIENLLYISYLFENWNKNFNKSTLLSSKIININVLQNQALDRLTICNNYRYTCILSVVGVINYWIHLTNSNRFFYFNARGPTTSYLEWASVAFYKAWRILTIQQILISKLQKDKCTVQV
ncbi:hypothetical protein AGLY_005693 [Aphis glycines]|uniref:Uncharacterized protein n=1 Tax=Aphis glycines TaxID=307491 RepID=A0A6G0TU12_APHGL|nr:hypothetical protein AGLY_005693 [Aphis glycines]